MSDASSVTVRRALPSDADAVVAVRDDAARWLLGRGIRQWAPGEVTGQHVLGWMTDGRLYVAEIDGRVVGSVRLAWSDPEVWPGSDETDEPVAYVQSLVASRTPSARGVGRLLLAHVEQVAAGSGRTLVRLSCLHGNEPLERFYLTAGYTIVGRQRFDDVPGWQPVTLLEKRLS